MTTQKPTVKELFSKPEAEVVSFLSSIYEHSPWVAQALVASNVSYMSFETVSELASAMKEIVSAATHEKQHELLSAHPDLCEKVNKVAELTPESQEEQGKAGLQTLTLEELERFHQWNNVYREKFGFPFILAVRNATKYTVLSALEGRVKNPVHVEFSTAMQQVHKIAWMRLLAKLDTSDAKGFLTCHVLDTANGCPGEFFPEKSVERRVNNARNSCRSLFA